jgi:hypothetical protein
MFPQPLQLEETQSQLQHIYRRKRVWKISDVKSLFHGSKIDESEQVSSKAANGK